MISLFGNFLAQQRLKIGRKAKLNANEKLTGKGTFLATKCTNYFLDWNLMNYDDFETLWLFSMNLNTLAGIRLTLELKHRLHSSHLNLDLKDSKLVNRKEIF